jgi:hypothetical protein
LLSSWPLSIICERNLKWWRVEERRGEEGGVEWWRRGEEKKERE